MTATALNSHTFDNLLYILENEFDWPMLSASTGFTNATNWSPDIVGSDNSTYQVRSRGGFAV